MEGNTQTKHTPGPRTVEGAKVYATIGDNQKALIGTCYGYDEGEAVANARLFAAATDLLEAAKELVRKVEAGKARSTRSYAAFKTAIAKAEGN